MGGGPSRYPVVWEDTSWEQNVMRPEETFYPVVQLIETVAAGYGRNGFIGEQVAIPCGDFRMRLDTDEQGCIKSWRLDETAPRAVVLAFVLHRVVRDYQSEFVSRTIRREMVLTGTGNRTRILVRRDIQRTPAAAQLRALDRAIRSGSSYKFEKAFFALSSRAWDYLAFGWRYTHERGALDDYAGPREVAAATIPRRILAPTFVAAFLPETLRLVSAPGRPWTHPRDAALAAVLRVFVEASGVVSASVRLGGHDAPAGAGADFVREIEKLFRVSLMPRGSTHAIRRAKSRMHSR